MKFFRLILLSIVYVLFVNPAIASHIVGGEVTYVYLGDSTSAGSGILLHKYKVSLSIYEDCLNGQPEAIAQDNPAFLGVFDAFTGAIYEIDTGETGVNYASSVVVPDNLSSPCGSIVISASACLLKKTFIKTYALPSNIHGYVVATERCCRNAAIVNINNPSDNGATYYCSIPPNTIPNNSAIFKNYPPQIICINVPLVYDNSATDADGDSLSYGFCAALNGGSNVTLKPVPYYPNFGDTVNYLTPYSAQVPFTGSPAIKINPVTGLITGTPDKLGRYLVTVYCNEWRGGALINTIRREFQFVVNDECSFTPVGPYAGPDTIIVAGESVPFHAVGGTSYTWTPSTYLNNPSIADPVGTFPMAGVFVYTLHETSDTICNGTATKKITVLDHSELFVPSAFTPNGDGRNDLLRPFPLGDTATLVSFKVFNRHGNMVYNGGPQDPGWDGYYKGVKQDLGVYFWEILYDDNKGVQRKIKGDATLVR